MIIPGYKEGSDITVMNTYYSKPYKDEYGDWQDDEITLVYKDNTTGQKARHTIKKPDHEFYVLKDTADTGYPQFFTDKNNCTKVTAPHNKLLSKIAEITGKTEEYKNNIACGNKNANNELHTDSAIMFSDTDVEDHYRFRFGNEYTNNIGKIYRGFFDIEVDGKYQKGDFPEPGECPINCCSYLDEKTNTVYTFILRNPENPLIEEFEKSVSKELFDELHDFVVQAVGGWKQATRYKVIDLKFEMQFFDSEISMIKRMFELFHTINPDFMLVWNMSFDIPYIIERCYTLGYYPEDIMCDHNPAYKSERKVARYFMDQRHKSDPAERTDECVITGNITWLCQMIQFCSRRKSQIGSFTNFKLDTIGERIAKVKKLKYHHITDSIIKLPYIDFKTFVFYNIMDVIVQKCIEEKCNDIGYIFMKCLTNNTIYRKGHRQTTYLANRFALEFFNEGYFIGNNTNRHNEKKEFPGAVVPDPSLTDGYSKIYVNGSPIMVANNTLDEDFKALYPSITLEHNLAPNTLIGFINMDTKVYENENRFNKELYCRSGEMIDNLASENIIEFSKRYFHIAGFLEFILEDMVEYMNHMNNHKTVYFTEKYDRNPLRFECDSRNPLRFDEVENLDYSVYRETLRQKVGL